MNLFELSAKLTLDDSKFNTGIANATSTGKNFSSSLGTTLSKGLGVLATGTVAAVSAVSTAIGALGVIGFNYNKQIETYTTNFEVMLGDAAAAAEKVEQLKIMGAQTPFQLGDLASATEQLLAFGVANEDTQEYLTQLGDISLGSTDKLNTLVNAFGKMNSTGKVTLETINMMAEQGFNPLQEISRTTGESMESLYDRVSAGTVSLDEITAAFESATTAGGQFEGGMAKASQTTAGLISTLKDNAQALVGEVFQPISDSILQTLLPAAIGYVEQLGTAFKEGGVDGLIAAGSDILGNVLTGMVEGLPKVVEIAIQVLTGLTQALIDNAPQIALAAGQLLTSLAEGIFTMLPMLLQLAFDLVINFANYLAENANQLINGAVAMMLTLGQLIIENLPTLLLVVIQLITALATAIAENSPMFVDGAVALMMGLIQGLWQALPAILSALGQLIVAWINMLVAYYGAWIEQGKNLINNLWNGAKEIWSNLTSWVSSSIQGLLDTFLQSVSGFFDIGKNIVTGIWNGIQSGWTWLLDGIANLASGLLDAAKGALGIASPSKEFAKIGAWSAEGMGVGFDEKFKDVKRSIENSLDFSGAVTPITADATGATSQRAVTVVQNIYTQAKTAADLLQETIYQQERAVLLGAT